MGERSKQFNIFAQDEWHVRRNLTVTYGVRWEYNKPATEVSENPYVPDKPVDGSQGPVTFVKAGSWWKRSNANAFAPRIGLSWSPGDHSKFVVHAGYGLAFDSIPTYAAAAAANSVPGLAYSCTATTYGVASTTGCGTVPANTRLAQGFPQQLLAPSVLPSSFLTPPLQFLGSAPNSVLFDPNFQDGDRAAVESHDAARTAWGFCFPDGLRRESRTAAVQSDRPQPD